MMLFNILFIFIKYKTSERKKYYLKLTIHIYYKIILNFIFYYYNNLYLKIT